MRPVKPGTAASRLQALALSHVSAQQTMLQQRRFGAQYIPFCQMFTTLLNHLLAKLTWGNYLWTLILLSSSIWLPWILAVAEGCPTHTGTRCCLWPQTAWWAAEEQGWDMRTRYLLYKEGGTLVGPSRGDGVILVRWSRLGLWREHVVSGDGVAASSH